MYRLLIALLALLSVSLLAWIVALIDANYVITLVGIEGAVCEVPSWLSWICGQEESSVPAIQIAIIFAFTMVIAIFGGSIWQFISALPARLAERRAAQRKERGYVALTKGLAAVAAGDAKESAQLATKSKNLLKDQKLTALLSAQSAQLQGKEGMATGEFKRLLEDEETAFLGLRGLAMQALREGRDVEALRYVKEAQELKPNAPWVLDLLYQLELRDGNALGSAAAVKQAQIGGHVARENAAARLAPLYTHEAQTALAEGKIDEAFTHSGKALEQVSGYLPAVLIRAKALLALEKPGQAKSLISRNWKKTSHPDMLPLYLQGSNTDTEQKAKRAGLSLLKGSQTRAGQTALGEFLLEHLDLAPARTALEAAQDRGSARASQILDHMPAIEAAIAEAEALEGDEAEAAKEKAKDLVQVALSAANDSAWLCAACGSAHADWQLHCGSCESTGTIEWQDLDDRRVVQPTRSLIERRSL